MLIRFYTVIENDKTTVIYERNWKVVSKQETTNPLIYIGRVLEKISKEQHVIHNIDVRITGGLLEIGNN